MDIEILKFIIKVLLLVLEGISMLEKNVKKSIKKSRFPSIFYFKILILLVNYFIPYCFKCNIFCYSFFTEVKIFSV